MGLSFAPAFARIRFACGAWCGLSCGGAAMQDDAMRQLMLEYAGTEMHRVPWVEIANKLAERFLGCKRDGKQCAPRPSLSLARSINVCWM